MIALRTSFHYSVQDVPLSLMQSMNTRNNTQPKTEASSGNLVTSDYSLWHHIKKSHVFFVLREYGHL